MTLFSAKVRVGAKKNSRKNLKSAVRDFMSNDDSFLQSLEVNGWAVADGLLPKPLTERLATEAETLWSAGRFHPARIGRGAGTTLQSEIRGDSICWLDPAQQNPDEFAAVHDFLHWARGFRDALNERYFLGLNSQEFHFARYPAGRGYARHLDQHAGTRARKISLVLYLNSIWHEADGGELVMDTDSGEVRVLPTFGRIVVFRSDLIAHEVLPCFQTRWSLTGWFRTEVQSLP
jgi:SM-20-related protein